MMHFKKTLILFFCFFQSLLMYGQKTNWLVGNWIGVDNGIAQVRFNRVINIESVTANSFKGMRSVEAAFNNQIKIVTAINGYMDDKTFRVENEKIIYKKDPPRSQWMDCSKCVAENSFYIKKDKIFITSKVNGCSNFCDGVSLYYRPLQDFDTSTQRHLVKLFGSAEDIATFKPYNNITVLTEASDSLKKIEILARIAEQRYKDSIINEQNTARKISDQQFKDSLKNVAKNAKMRQRQTEDSLLQIRQIAVLKKQQIEDSLSTAIKSAKQNQKAKADSLAIVQRQQKLVSDSIKIADAMALKSRQQQYKDSVSKINTNNSKQPVTVPEISATTVADKTRLLTERDNVLIESYHITTPDLLIELFDNAQIDGDRVSVFYNDSLIVNNKMLLRQPITLKLRAQHSIPKQEFILVAENLGTIPPNTALMRITAGKQVYEVTLKSDLTKNAKVILYYDGN